MEFQPIYAPFAEGTDDGGFRLSLMVEGIHCAGCISRIEKKLGAHPDVRAARLNFSTRRLNIVWQGIPERANDFVREIVEMGYAVHPFRAGKIEKTDSEEKRLLFALGVAGFAAGNIMLLSIGLWVTDAHSMGGAMRDFLHWISAMIAIPAVVYAGRPFFSSAFRALSKGRTNMDVPISVGLILTCGISLFQLLRHGEHAYFDSAVMLMFFLLIGRYLDARVRARARGAAGDLLALMEGTATVLENDHPRLIPISDIRSGMIVLVGMGERIPVDGRLIAGSSHLDLSMVTGETDPIPVAAGASVLSGAMNLSAPLTLRAEKEAAHSFLADIVSLMETAEQGHARYVRLADRAAQLYTPVVHTLALLSFLGWILFGGMAWPEALLIAATVLIITCPCALGLAVPVVQVLAVGRLMARGILVKAGDALERLAGVDTVVLDKTGTLTMGQPTLRNKEGIAPEDLALAASMASRSRHPLARALMQVYDGPILDLTVEEVPGKGLRAPLPDGEARLGSRAWCGVAAASAADSDSSESAETWMVRNGREPIRLIFDDPLRSDAAAAIAALRARGLSVSILSGDRAARVQKVAQDLGVEQFYAHKTPQEKYALISEMKARDARVLMVGDGLNDAPVLALADASISPSSAMDITQNAADIVFTGAGLMAIVRAYDAARFSGRLVRQNFILAIVYNALAIPMAMAGYVTPLIAALAMSGSSLVVIANSYRLRGRV